MKVSEVFATGRYYGGDCNDCYHCFDGDYYPYFPGYDYKRDYGRTPYYYNGYNYGGYTYRGYKRFLGIIG